MQRCVIKSIDKIIISTAAAIAVVMTAFVFLSSVMRYIFGSPFKFTENVVGLLFVLMVFIAMASVTLRSGHIEVDIVRSLSGERIQKVTLTLSRLITTFFFGIISWLTFNFFQTSYELGARAAESRMLLWPWIIVMLCGSISACLASAVSLMGPLLKK